MPGQKEVKQVKIYGALVVRSLETTLTACGTIVYFDFHQENYVFMILHFFSSLSFSLNFLYTLIFFTLLPKLLYLSFPW